MGGTDTIELASSGASPLNVDRPFVFVLLDRRSGAILFLGRIGDPTAA